MFGNNTPVGRARGDGSALSVISIFGTIQGEGPFAGKPATFIRLAGCNLRCWFCDTEFTEGAKEVLAEDLVEQACQNKARLVVITGGEPTRQNLEPLIKGLLGHGFKIQIETAGSFWQPIFTHSEVHLVVSPKTSYVHALIAKYAMAYKYIIDGGPRNLEWGLPLMPNQGPNGTEGSSPAMPPNHFPKDRIYLSPCDVDDDRGEGNMQEVARIAMERGYRAGIQMHKFLEVE